MSVCGNQGSLGKRGIAGVIEMCYSHTMKSGRALAAKPALPPGALGTVFTVSAVAVPSRFLPLPLGQSLFSCYRYLKPSRDARSNRSRQSKQQFDKTHSHHPLSANGVRRKAEVHPSGNYSTKLAHAYGSGDQTPFRSARSRRSCSSCNPRSNAARPA